MYKKVLLLVALNGVVECHAGTIYKCVDTQGAMSFQSMPCPSKSSQTEVVLRKGPADPAAESTPDVPAAPVTATEAAEPPLPNTAPPTAQTRQAEISYECTVANGYVFFRHRHCPRTVPIGTSTSTLPDGRTKVGDNNLRVTERVVGREEACRKMRAPSASDREGYDLDDKTSAYDKARGNDPCG